jgi:hypothetical protein
LSSGAEVARVGSRFGAVASTGGNCQSCTVVYTIPHLRELVGHERRIYGAAQHRHMCTEQGALLQPSAGLVLIDEGGSGALASPEVLESRRGTTSRAAAALRAHLRASGLWPRRSRSFRTAIKVATLRVRGIGSCCSGPECGSAWMGAECMGGSGT